MKPLHLELTGLHSYADTVTVDFEALARFGLFGIFGPIGSGKSSLLDGLTLALYGLVDRVAGRSRRGIVNHDVDRLEVRLRFQTRDAEGQPEIWEVHRCYREVEGVAMRVASRLLRVRDQLVVADKEREIHDAIVELVGLEAEDFMRAVVLPQGRFLDVLHLKGADRRAMLQRIFRLGAYGEGLRHELRDRTAAAREEVARLAGERHGIGEATQGRVRAAREAAESAAAAWKEAAEVAEQAARRRAEGERAREAQRALIVARAALAEVAAREPEMSAIAVRLGEAEALLPAVEPSRRWRRAAERAVERSRMAREAHAAHQRTLDARNAAEAAVAAREAAEEAEGPRRRARLAALEEAARQQLERRAAEERGGQLAREVEALRAELERQEQEQQAARHQLAALDAARRRDRRRIDAIRVAPDERERVDALLDAAGAVERARSEQQRCRARLDRLLDVEARLAFRLQAEEHEAEALAEQARARRAAVAEARAALARTRPAPIERVEAVRALVEAAARREQVEARLRELADRLQDRRAEAEAAHAELDAVRARAGNRPIPTDLQQAALRLALELGPNAPCPVCGSLDHPAPAAPPEPGERDGEGLGIHLEGLLTAAARAQGHVQSTEEAIAAARAELATFATSSLPADVEGSPADWLAAQRSLALRHEVLRAELDAADAAALEAEQAAEAARRPLATLRAEQAAERARREESEASLATATDEEGLAWAKVHPLLGERFTLFDVPRLRVDLAKRDAELTDLEAAVRANEAERDALQQLRSDLQQAIGAGGRSLARLEARLAAEQATVAALHEQLSAVGVPDPAAEIEALEAAATAAAAAIRQGRADLATSSEVEQRARSEAAARGAEARSSAEELAETWAEWSAADPTLPGHGGVLPLDGTLLPTWERAAERCAACPSPAEVAGWRDALAAHHAELDRARGRVEALQTDGATPPDDPTFARFVAEAEAAARDLDTAREAHSLARRELEVLEDRWARLQALEAQLTEAHESLSRLEHLTSVLRGDRFVEYVANDLLEDLAATASEHLVHLTEGRYALVLDDSGGFLVRDDDAGGVLRPVQSLSGGEAFLTSLALALALSTQIQARGSRPLEFFFLDEGFGSLDPEALDRVMTAIEGMRDDHRVIGLISHVPGVRERVPAWLQVHPAGTRGRGSTVSAHPA